MQALYDPEKTYMDNLQNGPFFTGAVPKRAPFKTVEFLGFPIASRIGIPAGPLLNSNWIALAADLGYDVLTYKTIRSYAHPSHPLPNIAFIDCPGQLNPGSLPDHVKRLEGKPWSIEQLAITNSFGNPSLPPEYLKKDIPLALRKLHPGQLLIVSVFGTTKEQYLAAARLAKECRAPIIEANYSCPNVAKSEGSLFTDPQMVEELSRSLVKEIGSTPLVVKLGAMQDFLLLQEVLKACARAGVRAVCGINTISLAVSPPLTGGRSTCGICGSPILQAALDFTRRTRKIIDREKLDMELMATGGAVRPEHFQLMLDAGASVAMTATGMMWNPYLASAFHHISKEEPTCLMTH